MSTVIKDFPVKISNESLDYDKFISILAKKSNLNDITNANIKYEGVEAFDSKSEKKLMSLDSVKNLYDAL